MSHDSSGHVICHTTAVDMLDMLYVTRYQWACWTCYMSHDSSRHVGHVICHTIAVDMLDMLYVTR